MTIRLTFPRIASGVSVGRAALLAVVALATVSLPEESAAQEDASAPAASAAAETTPAPTEESPAASTPTERLWEEGLEAGLAAAQASGKPAFVVAGGVDCPWCRRLEDELELPSLSEELNRWTLVHVDVDEAPGDARRLAVGPIPALRLLRPTGAAVASREGFLEAESLREWLQEHREAAGAGADPTLIAEGEPDAKAVLRLVGFLTDRDPLLRDAAIKRLAAAPRLAAPALLEQLREEKLAGRLAALEVFALWDAPIEALDPWRPETIDQAALDALERWADERPSTDVDAVAAFDEADVAEVEREMERLLNLDLSAGAPLRARLARYGAAALPIVHARLETAATNEERQKLLALRYRLVASDSLALRDLGSLLSLASDDALARRKGAETLTSLAGPGDQGLLLEMFSDPDPLIRETALRGIERLDDGAASKSLVRLLQDPEPNVRAAVLKRLSEAQSAELVDEVAEYVRTESDPDLLVHAVRYLQQTASAKAVDAVAPLLEHASWQVRAQAVEALGALADSDYRSQHPVRAADVVAALIERLQDEDAFVVSRAATALQDSGGVLALEPTLDAAERFPDIAPSIIASVASNHPGSPLALKRLSAFANHDRAAIRTAASVALVRSSDAAGRDVALAALSDADPAVRRDVAAALSRSLDENLQEVRNEMLSLSSFGFGESVKAPPRDWDAKLQSLANGAGRKKWAAAQEPLRKMLVSDDVRERVAAAGALARLGHFNEAEPVLVREAASSEQVMETAAGALPWVPGDRRENFFQTLYDAATNDRQRTLLVNAAGQIYDESTPDLLWKLTEREDLSLEFAGTLFDALCSAYFGEYYRHDQADPATKRAVADAAGERLDGDPHPRLIALCLLAHGAAEAAKDAAREIADDPSAPEFLRTDAFQIQLALEADPAARQALIQEGFAGDDAGKRTVSLKAFVTGGDELAYLHDYAFRVPVSPASENHSPREPGPIVPKAPEGTTVESLRAFMPETDEERAQVAYLLALLGERDALDDLLALRESTGGVTSEVVTPEMTYRAIARLDATDHIDTLREISETLNSYSMSEFYWTIRIMTGEPALRLRKEIRDKHGADALR